MFEQYSDKFSNLYEAIPDGKVFRIYYDSTLNLLRIISRNSSTFEELREAFSVENTSAFFTKQYGYNPQARKYVINKFGYFSSGLVFEILSWIKTHYGDLTFVALSKNCINYINDILTPFKTKLSTTSFNIVNLSDDNGRNAERIKNGQYAYDFREYQKTSVEKLIFNGYGRGLIEIPTSGGKSFIISNFIWNIHKFINNNLKVMIFVPNTQLVEQFYKDLIDYGYNKACLAKFSGSLKAKERKQQDLQNAKIIIANRQYVFSKKQLLPPIDILICDEVHQCTAAASAEFISNCEAKIKIGCSGTLPKDKYNYWTLLGLFGKVLYKEEITDLQSQGFISKLSITLLDIMHKGVECDRNYLFHTNSLHKYHPDDFGNAEILFNDAYNQEQTFYQTNTDELYTPVMKYLNTLDENILVLFDRVETGKNLFNLAQQYVINKHASYIDGQTEIAIREDVRQEFEKSGNNILIGNVSILGTGINIKRLTHIVFLISTKSYSRVIQSIGRTLRLHNSKNEAHLIECRFNFKYSQKHFNERMHMYKQIYHKSKPDEVIQLEI